MIKILDYLFLVIMVTCYLSFWWSVIGVFKLKRNRLDNLYTSLKVSSLLFWCSSIYIWSTKSLSLLHYVFGITITLISLVLFWWCQKYISTKNFSVVFGKDIPQSIEMSGPYRWVRHPFYTSYLICYFGVSLSLVSPLLFILSLIILGIYFVAIRIEESKFIVSEHFEQFIDYKKTTGALFPKFNKKS